MKRFILIWIFLGVLYAKGQVVSGVLDLREVSFDQPVELNGYWEFYWKKLITPGNFKEEAQYLYFPALWQDQVVNNDTLTSEGYGTYRMKLILSETPQDYALFMDDYYTASKIFVNGTMLVETGQVGINEESYKPSWQTHVIPLNGLQGQVEIVLQISNYLHSKGGAGDPMKFGLKDQLVSQINLYYRLDVILTVFFLLVALFFLIRFGFVTLDIASFYFSLFCLVYSYRIIGADLYVLHQYLDEYPWGLAIRIEYLTLFISPFLFAKYLESIYPKESSTKAINVLGAIGAVFVIITLVTSSTFFTRLVEPFFVILGGYFFYGFTIFTSALLEKRTGSIFGFIGVVIVFANFGYLMLAYVSWMPQNPLFSYAGYFLFLLFQTLQLVVISNQQFKDYGLETEE